MIDETEIVTKPDQITVQPQAGPVKSSVVTVSTGTDESKIGSVSVRAWLAIVLVLAYCLVVCYQVVILGKDIPDNFYSVVIMAVTYYFSQKKQ